MSSNPSKPRRVKSAKARLSPSEPSHLGAKPSPADQHKVVKEAQERVKSAKAIRDKHLASANVFPRPPSRSTKERFSSMYSKDFEGSYAPPAELRPTSPTRRHNPHPGKQFMVWRVPTREIGVPPEPEGLELPPEYITRNSDFDAIDELNSGLGGLKLPPPQPTSMEYGAYLHRQRPREPAPQGLRTRPVGPEVVERTMGDETAENLQQWMATASPEERQTILKMLKSVEEAQVNDTISKVMEPTAAKAVKGWLKGADQKERDVAVRLFSSLGSRQGRRQRSMSEPSIRPLSRQHLPPPMEGLQTSRTGVSSRQRARPLASGSGSRAAQNKPWPAGLWHHLPVRDPPPQVYHRGALFGAVRTDASHYNVHPEWPDYYNTSVSSDVVH